MEKREKSEGGGDCRMRRKPLLRQIERQRVPEERLFNLERRKAALKGRFRLA